VKTEIFIREIRAAIPAADVAEMAACPAMSDREPPGRTDEAAGDCRHAWWENGQGHVCHQPAAHSDPHHCEYCGQTKSE
jgi:hypothetical protein